MTAPFVIDLGFTRNDYAPSSRASASSPRCSAASPAAFSRGCGRSMPACGRAARCRAVSNLAFAWLSLVGVNQWALALAISVENFTGAIGTVIFVAYLSALCRSPLHTATQYALLTAFAAIGRTYLSSGAGYVAQATGWPAFFILSVAVAAPSLVLLAWLQRRGHFAALAKTP